MPKKYQPNDKYAKRAKEMGYRARSVFKLEEIQNQYKLIRPGDRVLDLGAAPGSFLQLISKLVVPTGLAIGVDLKIIEPFKSENLFTYQADIFEEEIYRLIEKEHSTSEFDVITSDLAPSTTGIKSVDAGRSFQLNEQVLLVADRYLKKGGHVLLKAFPGADHSDLQKMLKDRYKIHKTFKPNSVRSSSREIYLIGLGKQNV